MLVRRKLSEIPKGGVVYYLNTPFVSKGCVDDLALLSSSDNKIHITLPADTEVDCQSNMWVLVNKLQGETEEYEGWLADCLDDGNAETSLDSVCILQGYLTSWFVRRKILDYFVHEMEHRDYDDDREIRNQKLLKVEGPLNKLREACFDIDPDMELPIPSVIEKAIEQVLEEECTDD